MHIFLLVLVVPVKPQWQSSLQRLLTVSKELAANVMNVKTVSQLPKVTILMF